jgi:hypothetical protein
MTHIKTTCDICDETIFDQRLYPIEPRPRASLEIPGSCEVCDVCQYKVLDAIKQLRADHLAAKELPQALPARQQNNPNISLAKPRRPWQYGAWEKKSAACHRTGNTQKLMIHIAPLKGIFSRCAIGPLSKPRESGSTGS